MKNEIQQHKQLRIVLVLDSGPKLRYRLQAVCSFSTPVHNVSIKSMLMQSNKSPVHKNIKNTGKFQEK